MRTHEAFQPPDARRRDGRHGPSPQRGPPNSPCRPGMGEGVGLRTWAGRCREHLAPAPPHRRGHRGLHRHLLRRDHLSAERPDGRGDRARAGVRTGTECSGHRRDRRLQSAQVVPQAQQGTPRDASSRRSNSAAASSPRSTATPPPRPCCWPPGLAGEAAVTSAPAGALSRNPAAGKPSTGMSHLPLTERPHPYPPPRIMLPTQPTPGATNHRPPHPRMTERNRRGTCEPRPAAPQCAPTSPDHLVVQPPRTRPHSRPTSEASAP